MFLGIFAALIAAQRLLELHFSREHENALRAKGAYERGAAHYPLIVALHAAWLLAMQLEGWLRGTELSPLWPMWVALFLGGQALRYWAILSLGERWTTRIMVLPGASLIGRGPYKFLPHPNYLAVVLEIFAAPLVFGAWITAGVFTLLKAGVLLVRIRTLLWSSEVLRVSTAATAWLPARCSEGNPHDGGQERPNHRSADQKETKQCRS